MLKKANNNINKISMDPEVHKQDYSKIGGSQFQEINALHDYKKIGW